MSAMIVNWNRERREKTRREGRVIFYNKMTCATKAIYVYVYIL